MRTTVQSATSRQASGTSVSSHGAQGGFTAAHTQSCTMRANRSASSDPARPRERTFAVSSSPAVVSDTAWWYPDVCHAVGDEHAGEEYASVIYIGSAPDCAKNRAYLPKQKASFLAGRSAPDFAAMDFEIDFKGRATETDLTDLGRRQMGF